MKKAYQKNLDEVFKELKSSSEGISIDAAKDRLGQYGKNEIKREKKDHPVVLFLKNFASPLVYVLLIATVFSLVLGEYVDAAIIGVAIFLDVIIGFVQEYKSSNALSALFDKTILETTVIRGGKKHLINAAKLVPGDIVVLKSGDKVPADGRIISSKNCEVSEALLTGESTPRKKHAEVINEDKVLAERDNMLYMGSSIASGRVTAVVTATGEEMEIGKISESIHESKEEKTHIQKELDRLAKFLAILFSVIIIIIFIIGLFRGHTFIEMFNEGVALAVSALPEGLPMSVTVVFAIGMQKILAKKGLIRKLLATETLGRTEILCIDKTGTLTKGKMEVEQIIAIDGEINIRKKSAIEDEFELKIVTGATLCNSAFREKVKGEEKFRGSPTDVALLKLGYKFDITKERIVNENKILDEYPFNQNLKLSAAMVERGNKNRLFVCGAPEVLLDRSRKIENSKSKVVAFSTEEKKRFHARNEKLATKGFRVLAIAYKDIDNSEDVIKPNFHKLTFLSLIVISDPVRSTAKDAVSRAKAAGLRLAVVTGDHKMTAKTVAESVGIASGEEEVLNGDELQKLSDEELYEKVEDIKVFARVSPDDKVRIVNVWQNKVKVVAMTGDGINDAPALHLANIGIALGSGTDIAKESADMVLLDDNLETILDAIKEGRRILDNIKKVVLYLLSDGVAEITLVGFSIIMGWPLPILAAQILWINLVEDGLPDIALALEPVTKDVFKIPPRIFNKPILDKELKLFTFLFGWVDDIALISLFAFLYLRGTDISLVQTMIFSVLTLDSLFFAYSCKNLRKPLYKIDVFNNKTLNFSFILGVILLIAAIYVPFLQRVLLTVPLEAKHWAMIVVVSVIDFITLEIIKSWFIRKKFWK